MSDSNVGPRPRADPGEHGPRHELIAGDVDARTSPNAFELGANGIEIDVFDYPASLLVWSERGTGELIVTNCALDSFLAMEPANPALVAVGLPDAWPRAGKAWMRVGDRYARALRTTLGTVWPRACTSSR